jgi:hypothetical protein
VGRESCAVAAEGAEAAGGEVASVVGVVHAVEAEVVVWKERRFGN